MFGKDNANTGKKDVASKSTGGSSSGGHSLNSIVQGTMIDGTIKANSDIRIDGTIKGKLFCDAKVIIGPTGKVEGEVRCQNAVIEGQLDGMLEVKELLNIRETAKVDGEVTTGKLIVQPGGVINGSLNMAGGKASSGAPAAAKKNVKTEKVAG